MIELSLDIVFLLLFAAFLAGLLDSVAGGGGMISIPALLIAGLPPVESLATNKLQGLFGTASATLAYAAKGQVDLRTQIGAAILAFAGGFAGAWVATRLPGDVFEVAIPILLIAIALYFMLKPNLGDIDGARRISPLAFAVTVPLALGFYDGLFGPGTGSFFMIAFVALAGYGVLKATAHTKLLNFGSNVGAFVLFALSGAVLWKIGLMMGVAQFAGARLGATLAMRSGARFIKPVLIVVCLVMAARLLADRFGVLANLPGL